MYEIIQGALWNTPLQKELIQFRNLSTPILVYFDSSDYYKQNI